MVQSRPQVLLLSLGEIPIGVHRVHDLKRESAVCQIVKSDEVDASPNIPFVVPGRVHPPMNGGGNASIGIFERYLHRIPLSQFQVHGCAWSEGR